MSLPSGWEETSGEWRVRLKDPARFVRIRPKTLAGVKGVYMVGGPIKGQGPSWVPQALRFKKSEWPSLTAAVGWYEASKFSVRENPPVSARTVVGIRLQSRNRRHVSLMWSDGKITRTKIADAVDLVGTSRMQDALDHPAKWIVIGQLRENPSPAKPRANPRGKYRILTVPEQHQLRIAKDTLRMSDAGARIMGGMTKDEARAVIRRFLGAKALDFFDHARPRKNPGRRENQPGGKFNPGDRVALHPGLSEWMQGDRYGNVVRVKRTGYVEVRLDSGRVRRFLPDLLTLEERAENPPRLRRGQLRLGAFRAGAEKAVEALSKTETELGAATAQAFELADRGEKVPDWLRERVRGLELERKAQLEALRMAIGRHAAVLEELTPATRATRKNPAGDSRKAAAALYREFHGVAPQSFHFEKIPDLSQLLHLGNALRVDYRAARARGAANTPYRHEFSRGSELFTDRTGRALVILGNLKVSRAPRGRFGYIRAGAGE